MHCVSRRGNVSPALIVLKVAQVPHHLPGGLPQLESISLRELCLRIWEWPMFLRRSRTTPTKSTLSCWIQPVFSESPPCSSLALTPACLLPRAFDFYYPKGAIYDHLGAVVAQ